MNLYSFRIADSMREEFLSLFPFTDGSEISEISSLFDDFNLLTCSHESGSAFFGRCILTATVFHIDCDHYCF